MNITVLLVAAFISGFIAPLIQKLFLNYKKHDVINHRSSHSVVATRTGGIVSFTVIFILSFYYYLNGIEVYDYSLLIPLSTMFIVGVYDDFYNADFKLKFFMQIIVAKMLIDQGLVIDNFYGVLGLEEIPRIFSQLFTVFVFLVIINSINFIDGVDGLAITEVIKVLIVFIYLLPIDSSLIFLGTITIGSLLPLYYYNYRKEKKIFLGDGGSLFLGTLVSIYIFNFLNDDFYFSLNKAVVSILVVLYPLVDLLRVFIIRIHKRKSPFQPDNSHLHHILLKKNIKHWKIGIILPIFFLIISYLLIIILKSF